MWSIITAQFRRLPGVALTSMLVVFISLLTGIVLGRAGLTICLLFGSAVLLTLILMLRQDELAVVLLIAVHLYVDWYLAFRIAGLVMALVLLPVFYIARSPRYPWCEPRLLWLWVIFLVITIIPSIRGAVTLYDALFYYPNVVLAAFLCYWLGTLLARDRRHLSRLFSLLAALGVLLALHTIIEETTGKIWFASTHYDALLSSVANYQLVGTNTHRAESFFIDPNWNGTFLAMLFFIPFGLFIESPTIFKKLYALAAMATILPAILFTYSSGAFIGLFAGILTFVLFVGRMRYRLGIMAFLLIAAMLVSIFFSDQLHIQLLHATNPDELDIRVGAWQTAIRVIQAYPLTGVGMGLNAYLLRADPFRVPAQFVPLAHPHNSYLELAAMGGLPVIGVFVLLLLSSLGFAIHNWRLSMLQYRPLLAGGIAAISVLIVNSFSINGWTLPPICAPG